jgi:hypothetical protein
MRDNYENPNVNERVMLRKLSKTRMGGCGLDLFRSGFGSVAGLLNTVINLRVP